MGTAAFDLAADIDGDGNPDLTGEGGAVFYGSGAKNTLLKRVVDGLGNEITVTYSSDGASCTGPTCTYQHDTCVGQLAREVFALRQRPRQRPHEGFVTPSNDHEVERTYSYHYNNAHMSVTGHGWLGFERRTVDMNAANLFGSSDALASSATRIDYETVARYDLTGQPTQKIMWPYLYRWLVCRGPPRLINSLRGQADARPSRARVSAAPKQLLRPAYADGPTHGSCRFRLLVGRFHRSLHRT